MKTQGLLQVPKLSYSTTNTTTKTINALGGGGFPEEVPRRNPMSLSSHKVYKNTTTITTTTTWGDGGGSTRRSL